jgi:hypothetical protein
MSKVILPNEKDRDEMRRLIRKVDTISGDGVMNSRDKIVIRSRRESTPPQFTSPGATLVCVRNATGSNGTASTAATWTYDIYDENNTTRLATGVSLNASRPNGKLTAKANGSYAWAKRINGEWVLLGFFNCEPEVTGTANCS